MKNYLIILSALLILGLDSCDNAGCRLKDNKLTAETRTGANTMSCKIDGKVWVANGIDDIEKIKGNCKFSVTTDYKLRPLQIHVSAKTDHKCARKNASMFFMIDTTFYEIRNSAKRYVLGEYSTDFNTNMAGYSDFGKGSFEDPGFSPVHYRSISAASKDSYVEITRYDPEAGILSGRFEFYAENKDGRGVAIGTRVHISEGRFDINYKNLPDCQTGSWY